MIAGSRYVDNKLSSDKLNLETLNSETKEKGYLMNTTNQIVPTQTKPLRKPTLPAPPKNESRLDSAIRLAGGTPLQPAFIRQYKWKVLLDEKLRRHIPFWWRGEYQLWLERGILAGLLTASVFMWLGLIFGMYEVITLGNVSLSLLAFFCWPPIVATVCLVAATLVLWPVFDRWNTPYWVGVSLQRYEEMAGVYYGFYPPLPRLPKELGLQVEEIQLREPKAEFRVDFLKYTNDPVLSVYKKVSFLPFLWREGRYLGIWK